MLSILPGLMARVLDRNLRGTLDLQVYTTTRELRYQGLLQRLLPEDFYTPRPPSLTHFFAGLALYICHIYKLPASLFKAFFGI